MKDDTLEKFYQENLEERLIACMTSSRDISLEEAMDIYYHSDLAQKIYEGKEGIQYLDYRALAQMLMDREKH